MSEGQSRGLHLSCSTLLTLILLLFCASALHAQKAKKPPAKPKEKPPIAEKITDNLYRVGAVVIDMAAKTATCPGEINMDRGTIEYLAVAPGGKTHESLLTLRVRPLHLQVALILLGLEPKNVLKQQGESKKPEGSPVEIKIRWQDKTGETQEFPADYFIAKQPDGEPAERHNWVFTGSRIFKEGFEADIVKSLVAVWHDPAAILDNPTEEGADNIFIVNASRTPKRGTRIEFIVKALPKEPISEKKER